MWLLEMRLGKVEKNCHRNLHRNQHVPSAARVLVVCMPFSLAVDTTFVCLGVDGTYTPQGGAGIAVRVIFKEPTEMAGLFDTGLAAPAYTAEIRASAVSSAAPGDQLVVVGKTYVVRQARQDALGLVWRLDLDPV